MEQLFGAIPSVLRSLDGNSAVEQALAIAAWARAAGELLAERTRAVEYRDKKLFVAVEDNTWKRHLEELSPQLVAKLNSLLGTGTVRFVEFQIDSKAVGRTKDEEAVPAGLSRIPESLIIAAEEIKEPELRRVFLEAAQSYLGRRT